MIRSAGSFHLSMRLAIVLVDRFLLEIARSAAEVVEPHLRIGAVG